MKLKKLGLVALSSIMAIGLLTGCGDKKYTIEFKPKSGDVYSFNGEMSLDVKTQAPKGVTGEVPQNIKANLKFNELIECKEITDDKVNVDTTLNDLSMGLDMGMMKLTIDKNNPEFKEIFNQVIGLKVNFAGDKKADKLNLKVIDGNKQELSSEEVAFSEVFKDNALLTSKKEEIYEGMELKEDPSEFIRGFEEGFKASSGQEVTPEVKAMLKDVKVSGKVESIKDGIATIKYNVENIKYEQDGIKANMSIIMDYKLNVKTGLPEYFELKLNMMGLPGMDLGAGLFEDPSEATIKKAPKEDVGTMDILITFKGNITKK